jgi:hypothetical protein
MSSIHEEKNPCQSCNASFVQKGGLKFHISSEHEKNKPYKRPNCDERFAKNVSLKGHISAIYEENKPFK